VAALDDLAQRITGCHVCPRLVAWREAAARDAPKRFAGQDYWARPVPGFGDPAARIVVIGLAPAASGANRTGRVFTGDRSGDFLYASMYRNGLANQPTSTARDDGLVLHNAYVTAAVRCAPPANKPTIEERDACAPFFAEELALLAEASVFVVLGAFAFEALWRFLGGQIPLVKPRPKFQHGLEVMTERGTILGCFHPSQQNTFTGKLTEPMIDAVFARANELVG
jgi:uracil-DNA glycosylase family 4